MRPTWQEIAVAAYHRWQRRGGLHGNDREDWEAAEKDLMFAYNYRYVVRRRLSLPDGGEPTLLGRGEIGNRRRRCRFCEQAAPSAVFLAGLPALPRSVGNDALVAWDECEDCRAAYDAHLAGPFEAFARPLLADPPELSRATVPAPALKALVRFALSLSPVDELHHFGDTLEWVANPDHDHDAAVLEDLGCRVYLTPAPIAVPFAALARRVDDEAPWPYMVFFLGTSRVVFQTHLPLCPRDEDLEGSSVRPPELSMSLGDGPAHRPSRSFYLPVAPLGRPVATASR
jgi:hypothetical protein